MTNFYKHNATRNHSNYNQFSIRFREAMKREKFNRVSPLNNSPRSAINTSKYIIENNGKTIFISTPNFLFEELLDTLFKIARAEPNDKMPAKVLLEKAFNDDEFRRLKPNWDSLSWTKDFDVFQDHLKEESFLYFDDLQNQYYFYLFRGIENWGFEGGFLHALSGHYQDFTKFNPNPKGNSKFQYNSFLWDLVHCAISGDIFGKREDKNDGNYVINKKIKTKDKTMKMGLFWDNAKSLFFLNTVYLTSKKK
jgi:hypothetical protein